MEGGKGGAGQTSQSGQGPSMSANTGALSADLADQSALGQAHWEAVVALGIARDKDAQCGPVVEQKVSANATGGDRIHRFADTGAGPKMLRDSDHCLRPSYSGMRCWGQFRDPTQRPRFRPTGGAALAWPSVFAPGIIFPVFLAGLK